jgi:hypothetical protein
MTTDDTVSNCVALQTTIKTNNTSPNNNVGRIYGHSSTGNLRNNYATAPKDSLFKGSTPLSSVTSNANQRNGQTIIPATDAKKAVLYHDSLHWDFAVWAIKEGASFPYLQWESVVFVSPKTATVEIGGVTAQLTASVAGGNDAAVTWESLEPTIATVSNGAVTGLAKGTARIVVHSGSNADTATITVEYQQVTITPTTPAAIEVGKTVELTANIAATWKSLNESIATVNSDVNVKGTVTGVTAGTALIVASNGNKTDTATVTVGSGTTAVETLHATSLQTYPNPTAGVVYIDNADGADAEVYTIDGTLLLRSNAATAIDLSKYAAGTYIIKVGDKVAKVVKR